MSIDADFLQYVEIREIPSNSASDSIQNEGECLNETGTILWAKTDVPAKKVIGVIDKVRLFSLIFLRFYETKTFQSCTPSSYVTTEVTIYHPYSSIFHQALMHTLSQLRFSINF